MPLKSSITTISAPEFSTNNIILLLSETSPYGSSARFLLADLFWLLVNLFLSSSEIIPCLIYSAFNCASSAIISNATLKGLSFKQQYATL